MLVHNLTETRLFAGSSLHRRDTVQTFLKLSTLGILLFAALFLMPASGLPLDGEVLSSADTKSSAPELNEQTCRNTAVWSLSETKAALPTTQREVKQRGSQKKHVPSVEYQTYAESGSPVLFAESPVVTGISLPEGVTGVVHLQITPEEAGPKCREVYDVFELSLENYPKGYEAVIRYTLPLDEIEDDGKSPEDISLYFSDGDSWEKLPTIYSMDSCKAYFESVTTSLGVFAIVLEECSSPMESVTLRSKYLKPASVTLDVAPVCILTHPYSYTVTAE